MKITFRGPAGDLEGILEAPPPDAHASLRGAAIVCHPHPRFGGTMQNTIVFRVARALREVGLATLRFNFRGVEGSGGEHGGEGDEDLDARAALERLEAEYPGVELWAAGYSFGARTVCGLAGRADFGDRIARLLCIALPVLVFDCGEVDELVQPGLFVFGSQDEFGTLADMRERFPELPPGLELVEIEGADHYFRGCTPFVEERVRAWAETE